MFAALVAANFFRRAFVSNQQTRALTGSSKFIQKSICLRINSSKWALVCDTREISTSAQP